MSRTLYQHLVNRAKYPKPRNASFGSKELGRIHARCVFFKRKRDIEIEGHAVLTKSETARFLDWLKRAEEWQQA